MTTSQIETAQPSQTIDWVGNVEKAACSIVNWTVANSGFHHLVSKDWALSEGSARLADRVKNIAAALGAALALSGFAVIGFTAHRIKEGLCYAQEFLLSKIERSLSEDSETQETLSDESKPDIMKISAESSQKRISLEGNPSDEEGERTNEPECCGCQTRMERGAAETRDSQTSDLSASDLVLTEAFEEFKTHQPVAQKAAPDPE